MNQLITLALTVVVALSSCAATPSTPSADVTALSAQVAQLQATVAALEARLLAQEQATTAHEVRVLDQGAALASAQAEALLLADRLSAAEAAVLTASEQRQTDAAAIVDHAAAIAGIEATLTTLNAFDASAISLRLDAVEATTVGLDTAADRLQALEAKTASMSVMASDVFFSGVNVHIRNGAGQTSCGDPAEPACTGTGNLFVGYGEDGGGSRAGSHNVLIGRQHNFSGWGSVSVGESTSAGTRSVHANADLVSMRGVTVDLDGNDALSVAAPLVVVSGTNLVDVDGGLITLN